MPRWTIQPHSKSVTLFMGTAAAFLVICIVLFPDKAFQASLGGLSIWWKIVFPALLPFLVASEIMIAYGFVHLLGVLLEPVMRTCFRIPGVGGWAVALGFTAGYPAGAQVTGTLRKQNVISRYEGERLLSLSHAANPVVIVGVVAVGFFHNAELGLIIALVHFISAFLVGLLMRFYNGKENLSPELKAPDDPLHKLPLMKRCFLAMRQAHAKDGRTFGKLLGDAVTNAVQTLMVIGGYMMIFSVLLQVLSLSGIAAWFEQTLRFALVPFGFPKDSAAHLLTGLTEVHLGAYAVSQASSVSLVWKAAFAGAMLAWSGISVHAQVKSAIQGTDLRYAPFLLARVVQAVIAFVLTFVLWGPVNRYLSEAKPSFLMLDVQNNASPRVSLDQWTAWPFVPRMLVYTASFVVVLLAVSVLISLWNKWLRSR